MAGVLGALDASIGVYVGRFIRFNSWDALLHPLRVAEVLGDQLEVPARMAARSSGLTGFLLVGYLVVYSFTDLGLELDGDDLVRCPRERPRPDHDRPAARPRSWAEPWKIKMVEPLWMSTRPERERALPTPATTRSSCARRTSTSTSSPTRARTR